MPLLYNLLLPMLLFSACGQISTGDNHNTIRASEPIPESKAPFSVVELFTSESCSSCPAAEKLLAEYVDKPNVFVLEFHVDYWNHLNWKDKFSSPEYTNRQRWYAGIFNLNSVYTPQAVVNGKYELVGSDRQTLARYIQSNNGNTTVSLPDIKVNADERELLVSSQEKINNALLNIALVQRHAETLVKRGENAGVTIRHHNIVRGFETAALDGNTSLKINMPEGLSKDECLLMAYVQNKNNGEIVSIILLDMP